MIILTDFKAWAGRQTQKDWIRSLGLLVVFFVIGFVFRLAEWNSTATHLMSGDSQQVACFSVGKDAPEKFSKDYLLSNPQTFRYYTPFYVNVIRFLKWVSGSYVSAFRIQMEVLVLLHLLGFYWLARQVVSHRGLALLYSVAMFCYITVPMGEIWGFNGTTSIMPRTAFQAIFPFVVALYLLYRDEPEAWIYPSILTGLLMYIHPVSAPALAGGAFFFMVYRLWILKPPHALWMLVKPVFWISVVGLPYVIFYLFFHAHGTSEVMEYEQLKSIMLERLAPEWFDIKVAIKRIFRSALGGPTALRSTAVSAGILQVGVASIVLGLVSKKARQTMAILLSFMVGICFVSFVLPFIDQTISKSMGRFPVQIDLIRGYRYLIPMIFLVMLSLWVASVDWKPFLQVGYRLGMVSVFSVWIVFFLPAPLEWMAKAWAQGTLLPANQTDTETPEQFHHLRRAIREKIPADSLVHSKGLWDIRFNCERPIYYDHKDGGIFFSGNWSGLIEWKRRKKLTEEYISETSKDFEIALELLKQEGVEYWVVSKNWAFFQHKIIDLERKILWENENHYILKVA